jgi:hypothetical protein
MPGVLGCIRGDYACVLLSFARKAAGATSARLPRALSFEGGTYRQNSDASRRENVEVYPRHCEERRFVSPLPPLRGGREKKAHFIRNDGCLGYLKIESGKSTTGHILGV